jgi:hypothetical protein
MFNNLLSILLSRCFSLWFASDEEATHDLPMNWHVPEINLLACWAGVVLGIFSGMLLGLGFHREEFLGGYGSLARRLYRLAHISFFGLAGINFLFWATVTHCQLASSILPSASVALVIGAISMPVCCLATARWPLARHGFVVPVLSLLYGTGATFLALLH